MGQGNENLHCLQTGWDQRLQGPEPSGPAVAGLLQLLIDPLEAPVISVASGTTEIALVLLPGWPRTSVGGGGRRAG